MAASPLNPVPAWGAANGLIDLRKPVSTSSSEEALDRLLIAETVNRYGMAYDERREDVLSDCFTEDGVFDGSVAGAFEVGPYEGRDAVVQWLKDIWETQADQRRHCVLNLIVDDLAPESATVTAYMVLTGAENGAARLITTGFYRLNMAKEDDGIWRIAHFSAGFDAAF
ncbi:MAG TPA: nuclear transport factor 2 family protein [Baekduia sp.]|nr:nuclear transport factor 2 family protein [Baekduia sp.]